MKYLHTPLFNRSGNKIINSAVFLKKALTLLLLFADNPLLYVPLQSQPLSGTKEVFNR